YVHDFTIAPGSLLIISNNVEFYFMNSNGVTGVSLGSLNPGDNVLILGNGSFHQLVVVPEPSTLLLLMAGAAAIHYYRQRRRR
ncbi:MAG: PEP-CTERM sorting domain-containing protein, partial [Verrucomicrobiae bacterium]|nr:PEP-CTERM sorting domain-containing protein [Verrucomicrobiae bacterium]